MEQKVGLMGCRPGSGFFSHLGGCGTGSLPPVVESRGGGGTSG